MKFKYALKILSAIILATVLLSLIFLGIGVYRNNVTVPEPTQEELTTAMNRVVDWLSTNEAKITRIHNSALWWMLKEASLISDNQRLQEIYRDYKYSYLDLKPNNVWTPYFDDDYTPVIKDIFAFDHLRDYQVFFIYALSCDAQLAEEARIQKQLNPDFCSFHYLHPRCVTHQQMGVRYLNLKGCGDHRQLSDQLLDIIDDEISLDFRVTDSYLQRALMLTDGDRPLKPIWIRRILDAQQSDGGWGDFYPIIELGSLQLGSASTKIVKGPLESDFHATAQAVWLLAMLIEDRK